MTEPKATEPKPTEYRQTGFSRPTGATELWLVRHGESRAATADNPFPLVDGHGDPELHPNGRAQAERVADLLQDVPIDALYVTTLRRTGETAAPLCARRGFQPTVEPDLREVLLGEWEGGLLRIKAHEQDPVFLAVQAQERWDLIPGAESNERLTARTSAAIGRIVHRHPNQRVVAFVHGGIIANVLATAAGARPFSFMGAENGSLSRLVIHEGRTRVLSFNEVGHLAGLDTSSAMT